MRAMRLIEMMLVVLVAVLVACGTITVEREIRSGTAYGPGPVESINERIEMPVYRVDGLTIREVLTRETEYR